VSALRAGDALATATGRPIAVPEPRAAAPEHSSERTLVALQEAATTAGSLWIVMSTRRVALAKSSRADRGAAATYARSTQATKSAVCLHRITV